MADCANSAGAASEPVTAEVLTSCPGYGKSYTTDARICRLDAAGTTAEQDGPDPAAVAAAAAAAAAAGQDGLQFLCSKYSSLITRLREEVLARQQAEAEARLLEKRLRDEYQIWEQEKSTMATDHRRLREEISSLRSQLLGERHQREQVWGVLSSSSRGPSPSAARETHRPLEDLGVPPQTVRQQQVQHEQHQRLMSLLEEHSELQAEHRDLQEELAVCKEHLSRWRRKASDLEGQVTCATKVQQEAEGKARCLQEEMRQALRSASIARSRERSAVQRTLQEEQTLQDREERLKALRHDSRLNAKRADSAESQLAIANACEMEHQELARESEELKQRLRMAQEQGESLRLSHQQAEQSEARAAERAGEAKGELRAAQALGQASSDRARDLEDQLAATRDALAEVEADRVAKAGWAERLGRELADARSGEHEACCQRAHAAQELRKVRKQLDRVVGVGGGSAAATGGQLAECRKKLSEFEAACGRQENELAEERRARERCHLEAIRSGEKLRVARSQTAQLREKLRVVEEAELRFPSRFSARTASRGPRQQVSRGQPPQLGGPAACSGMARSSSTPAGKARSRPGQRVVSSRNSGPQAIEWDKDAWQKSPAEPLAAESSPGHWLENDIVDALLPPSPNPHPPPASASRTPPVADYLQPWPGSSPSTGDHGVQAVRDFVAQEEERLSFLSGEYGQSWEERGARTRSTSPQGSGVSARAALPPSWRSYEEQPRPSAPSQAALSQSLEGPRLPPPPPSLDKDISAMLSVQPRVLQVPSTSGDTPELVTAACSETSRCHNCGEAYIADSLFCRHCGKKRDQAPPE